MPPVIKVGDQNTLVPTNSFPHARFDFDFFNPIQSRVYEFYHEDTSVVVACPTASGKTCVAEMFLAHEVRKRGGKGMYLAPLRSLAQEKIDDWSDKSHSFSDLNLSICTGDYRITPNRRKELEEAQLIMMTSEMLDSQSRNFNEDKCGYLSDVGTLVVDESHLLTVPGRGDRLEAGLMRLTELAPKARLVLLSATMPNVDEISDWVSYSLTKKDTRLLVSSYRPCPLNVHYEKYFDGESSYEANELQKVDYAMQVIEYYPDDKFLIFAHTKRTGELMKQALGRAKLVAEFHNADLVKEKRRDLEGRFKNDNGFKYLVATSTLAWGVNTPARRVIVLGVHRGMSEVASYDVAQEVGRAGRPRYDPVGDAYVLLPESKYDLHVARLKNQARIESQMLADVNGRHKTLAFHLVNEIARERVTERDHVRLWYGRTLASFQSHELDEAVVNDTVELLRKCGAVREEQGKLKATGIGKVASLFYFTPFDVSDLRRNLSVYFDGEFRDDLALSLALGNTDTSRAGIVSKVEREEMSRYANMAKARLGEGTMYEPAVKAGFVYYMLLQGFFNQSFTSLLRNAQSDFPRVAQVIQAIDSFSGKWDKREFFRRLDLRVKYGVPEQLAYLCQLPHVGGAKAKALHQAGITTVKDVLANPTRVKTIAKLGDKRFAEVMAEAKKLGR
jgi:replicative superfamily II helicase